MKKEWFVIRKDLHEGPYTVSELDVLFSKRKIDANSAIWKEGIDDPINFGKFLESSAKARSTNYESSFVKTTITKVEEKVSLPKIAPVAEEPKLPRDPTPLITQTEINLAEIGLEQPIQKKKKKKKKKKIKQASPEFPVDIPKPLREPSTFIPDLINGFKSKLKFILIAGPLLMFIYVFGRLGMEYYQINFQAFSKPKMMKNNDYQKMVMSLTQDKYSNFSVSKDSTTIWMAFNSVFDGKVEILLTSKNDQNLNLAPLKIRGDGNFSDKLATFTRLNFEGSDKIIPGIYNVEIKNLTNHYEGYWISHLVNLNKIRNVNYEGIYLGNVNKEFYLNKLKRELEKKQNFHQGFMLEITQRRKTLKAILIQIEEEVREIIKNSNKRKAKRLIRDFKASYLKTYGYFFSMFVKENQDFFNKVVNTTFDNKKEIISGFNNLAKIAKASAGSCAEIIKILKRDKKLSIKSSIRLEKEILGKLKFYQKNL